MTNKNKCCYLIVAPSGTGKDTVVNRLCKDLNMTKVKSYTTRPRRPNDPQDVDNHIFISRTEYWKLRGKVATTIFNGHCYCATADQIDNNDFYIVDPDGIFEIKKRYGGRKKLKVIALAVEDSVRIQRMKDRGDTRNQIVSRTAYDDGAFIDYTEYADITIPNYDLEECVEDIKTYIKITSEEENEEEFND